MASGSGEVERLTRSKKTRVGGPATLLRSPDKPETEYTPKAEPEDRRRRGHHLVFLENGTIQINHVVSGLVTALMNRPSVQLNRFFSTGGMLNRAGTIFRPVYASNSAGLPRETEHAKVV